MNLQKHLQRLGVGGMQITKTRDFIDPNKVAYTRNMRIYQIGELRTRPGLGTEIFTTQTPDAIHTIKRINDTMLGSYAFILGAGSKIYYAQEASAPVEKITGLSGKPLSMAFVRGSQASKPWAYIADANSMWKMGPDGTTKNWSILGLNVPVTANITQRAFKVINEFNVTTGWANTGTAGALSTASRISFTIPAGGIIYDSGTTGWANIIPASIDANFQSGTMMTYNSGGGTEEKAIIEAVSQASGTTTIASIRYESGSTGWAVIQLTTPTQNLTTNSTIQITTSGTPYNIRVAEIINSNVDKPSIRVYSSITHIAGDAVVGVRSYRTYLQNNHIAGETVATDYCTFTNSTGVGYQTIAASLDLTKSDTLGTKAFIDSDEVHISIRLDNPAALSELQLKLDCDASTNDGTKNYYYYAIQPSAFASVGDSTSTTLTATQVDLQRQQIIGYQVPQDYNNYNNYDQQYGGYAGNVYAGAQDYSLTSPQGAYTEPIFGTASNSAGVSDTSSGANQWTELRIKISDFIRIGSDLSRGWKDIAAVIVQVNSNASLGVSLDSLYISGGYRVGSTVSNIAEPYNYIVVCRDRNTGDKSLASPAMRSGIKVDRNGVTLSFAKSSDTQVTDYDIYRWGGTITSWVYIGSVDAPSGGTVTFYDDLSDDTISANPALNREDYPVFPMLDNARTGTATVKGNVLEWVSGDSFNVLWAAGVRVLIRDSSNQTYLAGLYARPYSTTVMELDSSSGFTGTVTWTISEPVILNQPLAAVWGPYGGGIDNPTIFACGSMYQAGTLFWTNAGRPGTSDLRNQLEITSPQEPLIGGCVYDGQAFCWSRKRMFRIFPAGENQFQAQEVANSKGLSTRLGVAIGQLIFFLGDDGIYASTGATPYSITDRDLYPLFPHDGQLGEQINEIEVPDFSQRDKFNLEYKNDLLYFTYYSTAANYRTLVFDVSKLTAGMNANPEEAGGWVSVDDYYTPVTMVSNEDPDNDDRSRLLFGTTDGHVYLVTSDMDLGNDIPFAVETRSFSFDAPTVYKRFTVAQIEMNTGGKTVTVSTRTEFSASLVSQNTVSSSSRSTLETPFGTGGISAKYLSVAVSGSGAVKLYGVNVAYDVQGDSTNLGWGEVETLGDPGAKWWQGIEIEADTSGVDKQFQVYYDGGQAGPIITVNHNGQFAKGYSFDPPFIAHSVQLKPLDSNEIKWVSAKWITEPEPDLVKVWQPQPTSHDRQGWQHIRSIFIALRSTTDVTYTIIADSARTTTYTIPSTAGELKKIYLPIFSKGRIFSHKLSATTGFRLYQRDLEVHIKPWGSGEGYDIVKPYGKPSRTNGGAMI